MLTKPAAFWDASALVPLCVQQPATEQVRPHSRRFTPVVWWGSLAEVHSAVARLHRSGTIGTSGRDEALARLSSFSQNWEEIVPENSLRDLACSLLHKYSLRAADGLQLAAALTWCRERPKGRTFISFDSRLNDAAKSAGFSLPELSHTRR